MIDRPARAISLSPSCIACYRSIDVGNMMSVLYVDEIMGLPGKLLSFK